MKQPKAAQKPKPKPPKIKRPTVATTSKLPGGGVFGWLLGRDRSG